MLTSETEGPILIEMRSEHTVYLGMGSNLGDRARNIAEALRLLEGHPRVKIISLSHFYETEPLTLKGERQNYYLNCVLKLRTSINAVRLFHLMQEIEKILGRVRSTRWAPRTIDLDLLLFDNDIIRSKTLIIPHPEMHRRRFVLEPLAELSPTLLHPIKGITVQELLKRLKHEKKVTPLYKFQITHPAPEVINKSS